MTRDLQPTLVFESPAEQLEAAFDPSAAQAAEQATGSTGKPASDPFDWTDLDTETPGLTPGQHIPNVGHTPDNPEDVTGDVATVTGTGNQQPATGHAQSATAAGNPATGNTQPGSVIGDTLDSKSPRPRPREAVSDLAVTVPLHEQPPETVTERLRGLKPWQANFVLALMECGGVVGLACSACRISRQTYNKAIENVPDFALACREAVEHSTDLVEAAVMRGATVGDLRAKYHQGVIVGYERVRNTNDARLALELRGRMKEAEQRDLAAVNGSPKVPVTELPGIMATVFERLFGSNRGRPQAPQVIDVQVTKTDA